MLLGGLEFLLFPLVKGLFIGGAIAAAVTIAYLTFEVFRDWFTENKYVLSQTDTKKVAYSVKTAIETGQVAYVQGFFDTDKNEVIKQRVMRPESVASDVEQLHQSGKIVVYS